MRDVDLSQLTDEQLEEAVDQYDQAALTLHCLNEYQVVAGAADYCSLEDEAGRVMDCLAPAVREWDRRWRA